VVKLAVAALLALGLLAFPASAPPHRICDQIDPTPGVPGYAINVRDC
jgi:hypothetical protein